MKVALYSDSPAINTAMGKIIRRFTDYLLTKEDVQILRIGWHHAEAIDEAKQNLRVKTFNIAKGVKRDKELRSFLWQHHPDILFCFGDLFNFDHIEQIKHDYLRSFHHNLYVIGYFNIDAAPLSIHFIDLLAVFDRIFSTSRFAKKAINALPIDISNQIEKQVLYHAPLIEKTSTLPKDKLFTVLINAKNNFRKNLALHMEAFSIFAENKNDVRIIVLTNPRDPEGQDLEVLRDTNFTLSKTLRFHQSTNLAGITDNEVSDLYAQSHVVMLCSMGEGFGLPVVEGMLHRCIPIATDYSALSELVEGRGILIKPATYVYGTHNQRMAIPSAQDIAFALAKIYGMYKNDQKKLNKMLAAGEEFAQTLSWEFTFDEIFASFQSVMKETPKQSPFTRTPSLPLIRNYALNEVRRLQPKRMKIAVVKYGGFGDTIQLIPILKGIRRKYPEAYISVIISKGRELLAGLQIANSIMEIGNVGYDTTIKSILHIYDIIYDVRYVSRIYGKGTVNTDLSNRYKPFYDSWVFSNSRIADLNMHVIDIMIDTLGLREFCSIADLTFEVEDFSKEITQLGLKPKRFVVVHNTGGSVADLKSTPPYIFSDLVKTINEMGYDTVQMGSVDDPIIDNITHDIRGAIPINITPLFLKQARAYFGIEGFLYHLAKALSVKTIGIFAATPPVCFGYGDSTILAQYKCAPCWWNSFFPDGYWGAACLMGHASCINIPPVEVMRKKIQESLTSF